MSYGLPMSSPVIDHVVDSIVPASATLAEAARARVAHAGAPILEHLAARIGGARHAHELEVERRVLVVCAGDHGVGDPGISLGPSHPTIVAATAIADGTAALADVARAGRARIVLVDAGVAESNEMPPDTIAFGSQPSRDLLHGPALTPEAAVRGVEAGIALAISLSETGLDLLAVGALGVGSELAAAAILGSHPHELKMARLDPELAAAYRAGWSARTATGDRWARLVAFGGPETAVLVGLVLGAASLHVPVVLDGHATGAAAAIAVEIAPATADYLIAAHTGNVVHTRLLSRIGLGPIFGVGLGHGEGIGAAMVLPLVDQVTALARTSGSR